MFSSRHTPKGPIDAPPPSATTKKLVPNHHGAPLDLRAAARLLLAYLAHQNLSRTSRPTTRVTPGGTSLNSALAVVSRGSATPVSDHLTNGAMSSHALASGHESSSSSSSSSRACHHRDAATTTSSEKSGVTLGHLEATGLRFPPPPPRAHLSHVQAASTKRSREWGELAFQPGINWAAGGVRATASPVSSNTSWTSTAPPRQATAPTGTPPQVPVRGTAERSRRSLRRAHGGPQGDHRADAQSHVPADGRLGDGAVLQHPAVLPTQGGDRGQQRQALPRLDPADGAALADGEAEEAAQAAAARRGQHAAPTRARDDVPAGRGRRRRPDRRRDPSTGAFTTR